MIRDWPSLWFSHDGVVLVVVTQFSPSSVFFAVGCSEFVLSAGLLVSVVTSRFCRILGSWQLGAPSSSSLLVVWCLLAQAVFVFEAGDQHCVGLLFLL